MTIRLIPEVLDGSTAGRVPHVSPTNWTNRINDLQHVGWCDCGQRAFGTPLTPGQAGLRWAEAHCSACFTCASAPVPRPATAAA